MMQKIFVIDDSKIVLEMTKATLEKAGYRVITSETPLGNIFTIKQEKPDLVLIDVN